MLFLFLTSNEFNSIYFTIPFFYFPIRRPWMPDSCKPPRRFAATAKTNQANLPYFLVPTHIHTRAYMYIYARIHRFRYIHWCKSDSILLRDKLALLSCSCARPLICTFPLVPAPVFTSPLSGSSVASICAKIAQLYHHQPLAMAMYFENKKTSTNMIVQAALVLV